MSTLRERLAACDTDKEYDQVLSKAWQDFAGSDGAQALDVEIRTIHNHYARTLLSASVTPETRAFASGAVAALALLKGRIKDAVNANPDDFDYNLTIVAARDLDTDDIFDPSTN